MWINVDFRLLDVSLELSALEGFLKLIESQIDHVKKSEQLKLDALIKDQNLSSDDPEWHFAHQNYDHLIDFLLPRFFRGSFLIALYAVYESAVKEIAHLIQKKQGNVIPLSGYKHKGNNFLDEAKKYYKDILNFELCKDGRSWQYITMLSKIRHAIAHANGRIEMLNKKAQKSILNWEKQHNGIETQLGYIIVNSAFLQKTFKLVQNSLADLVERYKQWDSSEDKEDLMKNEQSKGPSRQSCGMPLNKPEDFGTGGNGLST